MAGTNQPFKEKQQSIIAASPKNCKNPSQQTQKPQVNITLV